MAGPARVAALRRLPRRSAGAAAVLLLATAAPVADASGRGHLQGDAARAQGRLAPAAEAPAAAPQPAATVQPDQQHRGRHQGRLREPAQPAAEAPAPAAAAPRGQTPAGAVRQAHRHPVRGAAHGAGGEAETPASTGGGEGLVTGTKGDRERQRRITERELRKQAKQAPTQGAAPRAVLQPAAAPAATTAAAAPAPAAPPAPAATVATGTPAGPTAVPVSSKKGHHRQRRATRRTTRSGATGRPVRTGVVAAGVAAAAASATPAAAGNRGAAAPKPAPAHTHHAESALVTTVTKIIGVVPSWVRLVIGSLVLLALGLAISSRLSAVRARRLARQRTALLEDVGLLQAALLPALPGRIGPVGTTAAYRPASGPAAGGDFFDVFALSDGQIGVIVGDVSGHGRDALPHTTLVRYTLRAYLEAGLSPRGALQTAAPVLERQLGDSFATVVLATYNPRSRMLVYSCAGHPPPLVMGESPIIPITACSAPPIGVGRTTGIRQTSVSVAGAATICFYTDGVVESRLHGELYGPDRLGHTLTRLGERTTAAELLDSVAATAERRPDDMAACLLHVEGGNEPARVVSEELEVDRGEAARDRAERFLLAGGLEPAEAAEVLSAARESVARHGRVVIELRQDGDAAPEVQLHPQNIAVFQPPLRDAAAVGSASL